MSSSPDHLYLDLSIVNNDNLGNAPKTSLSFNESRNNPILDNPSNYFLAIARFEVDTPAVTLPIFIPLLNVDGVNGDATIGGGLNQTAYTITMAEVNGNTMSNVSTLNVFWNAEDQTALKPINPSSVKSYAPLQNIFSKTSSAYIPNTSPTFTDFLFENVPFFPPVPPFSPEFIGKTLVCNEAEFSYNVVIPNIVSATSNSLIFTNITQTSNFSFIGASIKGTPLINGSVTIISETYSQANNSYTFGVSGSLNIGTLTNDILFFTFPNYPLFLPDTKIISYTPTGIGAIVGMSNPNKQNTLFTQLGFINFELVYFKTSTEPPVYTSQDITTGYYNCYSAKWWLNCVNYTLLNVWNLVSNGADPLLAPFLTIDANTNLITLYTPSDPAYNFAVQDTYASGLQNYSIPIWSGGATSPPIKYNIFFNEPLFNLFSSFPSVYYGNTIGNPTTALTIFTDAPSQQIATARPYLFNYYIQPINFNGLNKISITDNLSNTRNFTPTTSEYSPVPMWNPVQSIAFTSSLLPVVLSYDTPPRLYNAPSVVQEVSSGNNSLVTNMLSDIQVALTSGSEYKPQVLYIPQNEYRFIDLNGTTPIHQASFSVYFKTKYNQQIAIRLGCQCGANLKILFRRKRFNLGNLPPFDAN